MKFKSAMMLATLTFSMVSFAQVDNSSSNISGTVGKPASVPMEGLATASKWLLDRMHTLEIQAMVQDMNKNGVVERQMRAGFTASGALVYNYELLGSDVEDGSVKFYV